MYVTECIEPYPIILHSTEPLTSNTAHIGRIVLPERTSIEVEPEQRHPAQQTAFILGALGLSPTQCVEMQGHTVETTVRTNRSKATKNMGARTLAQATAQALCPPRMLTPAKLLEPFDLSEEQLVIAARLAHGDRLTDIQSRFKLSTRKLFADYIRTAYESTGTQSHANLVLFTILSGQLQPYLNDTYLSRQERANFLVSMSWQDNANSTPKPTNTVAETAKPVDVTLEENTASLIAEAAAAYAAGQPTEQLFAMRDRGWYAELLLALHNPDTGEQWEDILMQDLSAAAGFRKMLNNHNAPSLQFEQSTSTDAVINPASAEAWSRLRSRREFNPDLDTHKGRAGLVGALYKRAQLLTKEDALDLLQLKAEGEAARNEAVQRNVALVFFTALSMPYSPSSKLRDRLADGAEGLAAAVRGFDPELGFAFSSYAVQTIGRYILNTVWKTRDQNIDVNKSATTQHKTPVSLDSIIDQRLEHALLPSPRTAEVDQDKREALNSLLQNVFQTVGLQPLEIQALCGRFGVTPYERQYSVQELAPQIGITEFQLRRAFRAAQRKIMVSPESANMLHSYLRAT